MRLDRTVISGSDRVAADCTCPYGCDYDWCKHAAALAYVAAFLLDRDPDVRAVWTGQEPAAGVGSEQPRPRSSWTPTNSKRCAVRRPRSMPSHCWPPLTPWSRIPGVSSRGRKAVSTSIFQVANQDLKAYVATTTPMFDDADAVAREAFQVSAAICSLGMNQAANLAAFATYLGWTVEQVSALASKGSFSATHPANVAYPRGRGSGQAGRGVCTVHGSGHASCMPSVRLWGHRIRPCRIRDRSHRHPRRPRQQRAVGTLPVEAPAQPKRRVPQMPGS